MRCYSFLSAGQVIFGRHAVNQIPDGIARLRGSRIFLLTDKILDKCGITESLVLPLTQAGLTVQTFNGGEPEPSLAMVMEGVHAARSFRPDVIIGLGGGSNMDAAKLAAVALSHPGDLRDYVGEDRVPGPVLPIVCVPTTAGTGSEVSPAAVFTDTEKQLKVSVLSNYLRPQLAIVDPMLTLSCPAKVTADSGIDALTHAIEAYTAVDNDAYPLPAGERSVYQGKNPFADMTAEKAIRLVGQYLRRAVHNGQDLEARDGMALAATLGGMAFSNAGVALVHAMEYPVGAVTHCSHGAGNGLLLPYVMRYNLPFRQKAFAEIGGLLGLNTAGLSEAEAAEAAIREVEQLRQDIGIPLRLRELHAREDQIRGFSEKAFSIKRLMRVNPRFPTLEEIETVYRQAW